MLGFLLRTVSPKRFTSSGNCGVAILTLFCTSSAAISTLVPTSNVAFMVVLPSLVLLVCRNAIPGEPFIWVSMGVVTVCSTVCASAPVNPPVICTTGGVILGYWATVRLLIASNPTIIITMEITMAVTGLLMKVLAIIINI